MSTIFYFIAAIATVSIAAVAVSLALAIAADTAIDVVRIPEIFEKYKRYRADRKECPAMEYGDFVRLYCNKQVEIIWTGYDYKIRLRCGETTAKIVLERFWDYRRFEKLKERMQRHQLEGEFANFLRVVKIADGMNARKEVESCEF